MRLDKLDHKELAPHQFKDITEITREFLRIVKELGPSGVITLAMNALGSTIA